MQDASSDAFCSSGDKRTTRGGDDDDIQEAPTTKKSRTTAPQTCGGNYLRIMPTELLKLLAHFMHYGHTMGPRLLGHAMASLASMDGDAASRDAWLAHLRDPAWFPSMAYDEAYLDRLHGHDCYQEDINAPDAADDERFLGQGPSPCDDVDICGLCDSEYSSEGGRALYSRVTARPRAVSGIVPGSWSEQVSRYYALGARVHIGCLVSRLEKIEGFSALESSSSCCSSSSSSPSASSADAAERTMRGGALGRETLSRVARGDVRGIGVVACLDGYFAQRVVVRAEDVARLRRLCTVNRSFVEGIARDAAIAEQRHLVDSAASLGEPIRLLAVCLSSLGRDGILGSGNYGRTALVEQGNDDEEEEGRHGGGDVDVDDEEEGDDGGDAGYGRGAPLAGDCPHASEGSSGTVVASYQQPAKFVLGRLTRRSAVDILIRGDGVRGRETGAGDRGRRGPSSAEDVRLGDFRALISDAGYYRALRAIAGTPERAHRPANGAPVYAQLESSLVVALSTLSDRELHDLTEASSDLIGKRMRSHWKSLEQADRSLSADEKYTAISSAGTLLERVIMGPLAPLLSSNKTV